MHQGLCFREAMVREEHGGGRRQATCEPLSHEQSVRSRQEPVVIDRKSGVSTTVGVDGERLEALLA